MGTAKFGFTDDLFKKLHAALNAAGLGEVQMCLNEYPEDEFDESVDDEISFVKADGSKLDRYVQSGPYGISLNTSIYENGEFSGTLYGTIFEVTMIEAFVREAVKVIADDVRETPAPSAP